jgi:hypothetical protein
VSSNTEDEDPPTQRPSAQISDDEFWLVSYAEDDDRELTTKEIVAAMKRGEITLSTLIWRDGMGEWQTIASIDELRSRAGFIVQPFLTDAPPRPAGESLRAIAALAEDIEELPSSAIQSAPPSSLAEADFLGSDDGDSSLAPPRIDHAAFFKSSPPPDVAENPGALPALPSLGGKTAVAGTPTAVASVKAAAKSGGAKSEGGGGLKWVLVLCTIVGAAVAGFFLTHAKEDAAPPQPVAKPAELAAATVAPTTDTPPDSPAAGTAPSAAADMGQPVAAAPTATAPTLQPSQASTTKQAMPDSTGTPAATPATAPASTVAVAPATATAPKPAATPAPPRVTSTAPFDKSAASAALSQAAAQASSCRQQGDPSGTAQVEVTFSPSGRATRAIIGGPPFRGTATGSCIAQAMRNAQVPPFAGDLVTVQKRVVIQ